MASSISGRSAVCEAKFAGHTIRQRMLSMMLLVRGPRRRGFVCSRPAHSESDRCTESHGRLERQHGEWCASRTSRVLRFTVQRFNTHAQAKTKRSGERPISAASVAPQRAQEAQRYMNVTGREQPGGVWVGAGCACDPTGLRLLSFRGRCWRPKPVTLQL